MLRWSNSLCPIQSAPFVDPSISIKLKSILVHTSIEQLSFQIHKYKSEPASAVSSINFALSNCRSHKIFNSIRLVVDSA
ncbi:hypothetical protein L2E82_06476 [Cichorium intybus]|uniref:Uncharacterized protein n=1 Tax=Cichorium intybus TaxID=13427 RepID=A0ACB9H9N2_CICIN|nr:hypothetical protein L2E82_06476 [Cichorium intybus]